MFFDIVAVAIDGAGNVFMKECQTAHLTPEVSGVKEFTVASDYATVRNLALFFSGRSRLAIDRKGDIFVTEAGDNWPQTGANGLIDEMTPADNYATATDLGGMIAHPARVGIDDQGDVLVADNRAKEVYEVRRRATA